MSKKSGPTQDRETRRRDWYAQVDDQWSAFIGGLLSGQCRNSIEWRQLPDIIAVLDELSSVLRHLHYAFLPGGGGLELTGACKGLEAGTMQLEINSGELQYVCRPLSLTCVVLPGSPEWNYFDLALGRLPPLDKATALGALDEDCYGLVYNSRRPDINGRAVTIRSKKLTEYRRMLGGRIVIFPKNSPYNLDSGTDDGRHNGMGRELFRQSIQSAASIYMLGAENYQASRGAEICVDSPIAELRSNPEPFQSACPG